MTIKVKELVEYKQISPSEKTVHGHKLIRSQILNPAIGIIKCIKTLFAVFGAEPHKIMEIYKCVSAEEVKALAPVTPV